MSKFIEWLFGPAGLTATSDAWLISGNDLLLANTIADAVIGTGFLAIPLVLFCVVFKRSDFVFRPLIAMFACFVLLCSVRHWMSFFGLEVPVAPLAVLLNVITAIVSTGSAAMALRYLPHAVTMPSLAQIREADDVLRRTELRLHQAQKIEAVGKLTGGVAHDLNNMLQGMSGALDLAERRVTEGKIERLGTYFAAMRRSISNAASLINRLLTFAQRQRLEPIPVRPGPLLRHTAEVLDTIIGPTIKLELDLHETWVTMCDPGQFENAILNLVINARDAMEHGGTLRITSNNVALMPADIPSDESGAAAGDYMLIEVSDSGSGMTPEVINRAFEPYYTTKSMGDGAGLGLSQVNGFVRQTGGFVQLVSAPHKGTSVRLYLPRCSATMPANLRRGSAATPIGSGKLSGVVMLVDDDNEVRTLVNEALRDSGLTVIEADNGETALRILHADNLSLDALVTDIRMPGIGGRELVAAMREKLPNLPVVMITGYAGSDKPLPSGDNMRVLGKPFALSTLIDTLRAVMNADE